MSTIDLSKVTVVITTFLRPGYLHNCVVSIKGRLPECSIAVACDDGGYTDLSTYEPFKDLKYVQLPFDSGLTAKRNRAVELVETPYTLIASDDFDFSPASVRNGIKRMVCVLDTHSEIDVVCGTYNNKEYEGRLVYKPGEYIAECRIPASAFAHWASLRPIKDELRHSEWDNPYAVKIDLGINYFLARTTVLRQVPWDETIRPIGGEHADWFMMMKDYGKVVTWTPGAEIHTFEKNESWQHPEYRYYRRRAHLGHELFLKKWGVKRYYDFNEEPPK